jgi:hypothetical protein
VSTTCDRPVENSIAAALSQQLATCPLKTSVADLFRLALNWLSTVNESGGRANKIMLHMVPSY